MFEDVILESRVPSWVHSLTCALSFHRVDLVSMDEALRFSFALIAHEP